MYFYPRPLRGGRLDGDSCTAQILRFLSTPSARRATNQQKFNRRSVYISIHALCEEGDGFLLPCFCESGNFYPRPLRGGRPHIHIPALFRPMISIHALCEEGDLTRTALLLFLWIFLSTPSARRATLAGRFTSSTVLISIHALCEEGDLISIYRRFSAQ